MEGDKDRSALTGVVFVVLVVVAFFAVGGSTPDGDASARKVVKFYSDNGDKEIAAAVVLALGAAAELAFASTLRERFRALMPAGSSLPGLAFAGGVVSAAGFLTASTIHFALADYADDIRPAAAQAINAIDSDFFVPFVFGLSLLVFATSLMVLKVGLLPKWMAWVGIVMFVITFTPIGFIAFGLAGLWVIVASILLCLRVPQAPADTTAPG